MSLTPHSIEDQVAELHKQALLHDKAGQRAQAEEVYQQALALQERLVGQKHPDLMDSLSRIAYCYGRHGKHSEAESYIQCALDILEAKPGPNHRGILQTLDGLANWHRDRGDFGEADRYYRLVLGARQRLLGPNHPRVVKTEQKYAELLDVMANPEAEIERRKAEDAQVAAIRAKIFGGTLSGKSGA